MSTKLSMLALALIAMSSHTNAQSNLKGPFTLTVDLSQVKDAAGKVYLSYYNATTKVRYTDSAEIGAAPVVFKGELPEPVPTGIRIVAPGETRSRPKNTFTVYLQPGDVKVIAKDSLVNSTVTGDPLQQDFTTLQEKIADVEKPYMELYHQYAAAAKQNDSVTAKALEGKLDKEEEAETKTKDSIYKAFVLSNGNRSPVALYALTEYAGYYPDPAKVEPILHKLPKTYQELPTAKKLSDLLAIARITGIGQHAPDFTQADTLGTPVSLASFKGKYVLLDFWASWCGPCRMENPNVVKAYQQYKDKGFTVLSVSLDRPGDREKWLKAIHHDNLTWTHVSDLQFWNNAVAKTYGIQAIPQNFLIDKDGKIVAKNLRGEELTAKLAALIN